MKAILALSMILAVTGISQQSMAKGEDTRIDFYGSAAKEAYLKLQDISQKNDAVIQSHDAGSVNLSSENMNCRYSEDDSGNSNLKKASPDNFSCYFIMNKDGGVNCKNTAPTRPRAAATKKTGGM